MVLIFREPLVCPTPGEVAGLCGDGEGRDGLEGREAEEPPGEARSHGTMTHSSESLEEDDSLLDLFTRGYFIGIDHKEAQKQEKTHY